MVMVLLAKFHNEVFVPPPKDIELLLQPSAKPMMPPFAGTPLILLPTAPLNTCPPLVMINVLAIELVSCPTQM